MKHLQLGTHGPSVFPFALGCMGMSRMYGDTDDRESIATIHAALERGVNLIDTGDFYGQGHNELLVGKALHGKRDQALLSVKFGALRGPDGGWVGFDARPVAIKNFISYSLTRLGVDHIDIYRPSRLDPAVPIEDTVGAIADLVKAGYVRYIGLSEVGADTLRRANAVHPIVDLQIEYSLISRGPEDTIFPTVKELGMAVTGYGILSRGLLTGAKPGANDFRQHLPRFAGDNLAKNQSLVDALAQLAARRGVTPAQLAIAWARTKVPFLVPLVGARTRKQLDDALGALSLELSADDIVALESAIPPTAAAGSRYQEFQMKHLDSER